MTITLPETKEVIDLVELLIDEKLKLNVGPAWNLTDPTRGSYITFLKGRDNTIEGAIITDLAATLYIGGKLLQLTDSDLLDQFNSGQADEPVIETVTEVINNLRTLYNDIELNPHVSPTQTIVYQVPKSDDFAAWVLNPCKRVDYVWNTKLGTGILTLLAP